MTFVKLPKNKIDKTRNSPHVFIPKEKFNKIINRFPEGSSVYIPLLLGYKCGMRIGEAYAVTWDNVDFDNKTILIDKQLQWNESVKKWYITAPKYNSVRTIDIDNELADLLKRYKEKQKNAKIEYGDLYTNIYCDENKYISENRSEGIPVNFVNVRENGGFIQPRTMQYTSRVIHNELNYSDFDFHSLRHTHCTTLLENGFSPKYVQVRLGHKDLKFTIDIYNHITERQSQEGKEKLNQLY